MKRDEVLKRKDEIKSKYLTTTITMRELANEYGVSYQRIQQIINWEYKPNLSEEEKQSRKKKWQHKATKIYYEKQRTTIINALGGKCVHCGNSDYRVLQVDHINGGGVKEIKEKGQYKYRTDIIKMIEDGTVHTKYQLLCANCNWIKRYENNERCGGIPFSNQTLR